MCVCARARCKNDTATNLRVTTPTGVVQRGKVVAVGGIDVRAARYQCLHHGEVTVACRDLEDCVAVHIGCTNRKLVCVVVEQVRQKIEMPAPRGLVRGKCSIHGRICERRPGFRQGFHNCDRATPSCGAERVDALHRKKSTRHRGRNG